MSTIREEDLVWFLNKGHRVLGTVQFVSRTHATVKAHGRSYRVRLEHLEKQEHVRKD